MESVSRKLILTYIVFIVGCVIAFMKGATLGEYTAFATIVLAAYGASNITDKKLNGGKT